MVQVLYLLEVFILAHYGPPSTETPATETTIVRCHKNSWIHLTYLLLVTFETDDNYSIRFEMKTKQQYSHSTSSFVRYVRCGVWKSTRPILIKFITPWICSFRLWRSINHLLIYFLTYLLTNLQHHKQKTLLSFDRPRLKSREPLHWKSWHRNSVAVVWDILTGFSSPTDILAMHHK